ncbi:MAG: hypothetical protein AAGJ79_11890, partial [Verrucomicrobiota bacterium]
PELDVSMREELGQSMYAASVGGFRSVIATWQNIQAFTAFERKDWTTVEEKFQLITQLQPRVLDHWLTAKWHMSFNAYAHFRQQAELADTDWKAWQLYHVVAPGYLQRGEEFLLEGMRYLPDEALLYLDMGVLYSASDKHDDQCTAAGWFYEGMQKPDAHRVLRSHYLSSIARCPERTDEAYGAFREAYYDGFLTPTVRTRFEQFETADVEERMAGKSLTELKKIAAEEPGYLPLAALARYWSNADDPAKAVGIYREIAEIEGTPDHYRKKLGLELAKLPGNEKEAIEILYSFYMPRHPGIYPDVRAALVMMEDRLGVPEEERLIQEAARNAQEAVWN